jgi:hypothetical protein
MVLKFPAAQKQLGFIKQLRGLAREPWFAEEVDSCQLVRLDRARARLKAHARRADDAYTEFAALPRVA